MTGIVPLTSKFFTDQALADLAYWRRENPKILEKIASLIDDAMKNPTKGIGRPKPLRYNLEGAWSRRINHEHRLVYTFTNSTLNILQARYHYE
jgi:toxin YoeB